MSTSFNFFERGALPRPEVSPAEAEELVRTRFGVEGRAVELGSQQDANFRIDTDAETFVLKVSNPAFGAGDLDAQDRAAAHVAALEPDVLVPEAVPGVDGRTLQPTDVGGEPTTARLVRYVEGRMLSESAYLAPPIVAALGDLAGRTTRALASFEAELPQRELQWDLRHAEEVVTRLAPYVGVPGGSEAVQRAAAEAGGALVAVTQALPVQPIHGDLTDDNVVAVTDDDGRLRPVGVIDFGDLVQSWAVGELAVTLSSVLAYAGDDLARLLPAVRAFDAVRPLSDAELAALWPLTVLRAAALMVSGQHQASIDRGNEYAAKNLDREWQIFEVATSVPLAVGTELLRSAVRAARPSTPITGTRLLEVPARAVDLSTTSPELDGGVFLDDEDALLGRLLGGEGVVHTRYLEPRLTRTAINSLTAPATVPLGVDVRSVSRVAVRAPWAGRLSQRDGAVALETAGRTLWLDGDLDSVADGDVAAGDTLGDVTALRVQLGTGAERPPYFVPAGVAHAWRVVCPDPTPLLEHAADGGDGSNAEEWLARRDAAFATVQEHYFVDPPQIERGWRRHLFDVEGRSYLDMLNNVSILGHGHPRLSDAVERQWRRLNTNSRFHYRAVAEFSERLAALAPDPLDTVFLVNSGSEAVDLALRLAWANTGRRDVVSMREAYHGWTDATDAVSTSVADNPNALETRPPWVHTVPSPNPYRGAHRGAEAHRYAAEAVADIEALVSAGHPPAAFLSESFYGNAGGMALPDGYLAAVYPAVRAAGGLCIADEVQVGYGRLGAHFWGFEQQGVVPDIVTVAKAMGNGHPLGAVITTREIAEGYRGQGYFFSSAGGSPVSCVVGATVLDIMRDEALQENARVVGAHLRQRLLELADRHELIGAVHGMGLYVGVELVRDRETLEPATEETAAICERLRELGVIMQPTSDRMCVLKIKPPLGIGTADADFFADALDRVLSEGW
jgi:4-aminobutyrate aminotransferase-like enzyme/Ser/Thr protein kinase RdoA (MazF antagonist)